MRPLPIDEAMSLGIVQEVNRRLLHPAGLGLGYVQNRFLIFSLTTDEAVVTPDPEKARRFTGMLDAARGKRLGVHGYVEQPVDGLEGEVPLTLAPGNEAIEVLMEVVNRVANESGINPEKFADAVLIELLPQLAGLFALYLDGTVGLRRVAPADVNLLPRIRYLARILPEIARDRDISNEEIVEMSEGDKTTIYSQRIEGQLYEIELDEVDDLAEEVAHWPDAGPDDPARIAEVDERLKELWALAQPGMKWWRGDDTVRAQWREFQEEFAQRMDKWHETRDEVDRLVLGEIDAAALDNQKRALDELEERMAPLRAQLEALEAEREGVRRILYPLESAEEAIHYFQAIAS